MKFQRRERVIYERNPLAVVICQIQFSRILRVDAELPTEFQARVRADYPNLDVADKLLHLNAALRQGLEGGSQSSEQTILGAREFHFSDLDKKWTATLSSNFVALTANSSYERWELYRKRLKDLIQAVFDIYGPPTVTRIGLRYQDVLTRKLIGVDDHVPWTELVKPFLLSVFTSTDVPETDVKQLENSVVIGLEPGSLQFRTSLVQNVESKEQGFLIDSDFFLEGNQRTDVTSIIRTLDDFNTQAGAVFRWCITERLHNALGPKILA